MVKKLGRQTVQLSNPPTISAFFSIVSSKEGEGPLKHYFDMILDDAKYGEETWEKAESRMVKECVTNAIAKSKIPANEIDYIFAGDLLNQCISANYAIRDLDIPFFGLYGACSTMTEGLALASMLVDGGYARHAVAVTSSHFCSAERQFRFPLEYGGQRTPTTQWTVTGSGAVLLSQQGDGPYIRSVTTGKVIDLGINDLNNMGAAMAPAALDTLVTHFQESGKNFDDYDLVVTGDLGMLGKDILRDLLRQNGYDDKGKLDDCGCMIYDIEKQDVHCGGSGCGCSASVLCSYLLKEMKKGKWNNIAFMATGALMSTTSSQQGETIPGIAHLVTISREKEG